MNHAFLRLVSVIIILVFSVSIPTKAFSDCTSAYNSGEYYLRIPNYTKAYSCFQAALVVSRKEKNHEVEAKCLLALGRISNLLSKNDSASQFLRLGISLTKTYLKSDIGLEGVFEMELGKKEEERGNIEAAGEHYKSAIEKTEKAYGIRDIRTALAYSEYAGYFTFKRLYEPEIYWSNKAYTILLQTKVKDPKYACSILIQHATATKEFYCQNPDNVPVYYPLVRNYYRQSLEIARNYYKKPSLEEGTALQGLANTYTDFIRTYYANKNRNADANWFMADSIYKEAIRIKVLSLGKYNSTVATSRYTNALIYWYHPSLEKQIAALTKFNEAFTALDSSFQSSGALDCPKTPTTFDPYFLSVLLSSKSRLLGELYARTHQLKYLEAKYEHDKVRIKLWDSILASFSTKDVGSVISLWNNAPFEEAIQSAFELHQLIGEQQYAKDIFDIAEKGKNNEYTQKLIQQGAIRAGSNNLNTHSISLKFLQDKLNDSTAFIEFVQAPNDEIKESYGIVVTKNRYAVKKVVKREVTDSLQRELQRAMQEGNARRYAMISEKLYRQLIEPFLKEAGGKISAIIICPSGSYSKIPFEALTASKISGTSNDFRHLDYLLKHYTISYSLNAGMSFSDRNKETNKNFKKLAVFVPKFDTLPKLLFSRKQSEQLQKKFAGEYFFDNAATLTAFEKSSSGYSIVQVATHSVSADSIDDEGELLFSDGSMRLSDLYGWKMPTDLCIISACQTGDGRQEYGDGIRSFSRAFAYSGAKGTISTLWCVDDKATAQVLEHFYNQLENGDMTPVSLKKAKLLYAATCSSSELANPFYWAGIVYSGYPEQQIQLDRHYPFMKYLTLALASALLIGWLIKKMKRGI